MSFDLFWPDNWYAKVLILGLVTYAIHWPIAYYVDRRLGITGKEWHNTIAGTASLGQAVMVMTIYFIFVTPPFLEDALRGIVVFLKVIGGIKLLYLTLFLSRSWAQIVEANDSKTFFFDNHVLISQFPFILYVPGIFFLRLLYFSVMYTVVSKGPSILCRGAHSDDSPSRIEDFDIEKHLQPSFNYFFPFSRFIKFQILPIWVVSVLVSAGFFVWIWNTGFEPGAYFDPNHNNFFQMKLAIPILLGTFVIGVPIRFWFGGMSISSDGLQIKSPITLVVLAYLSTALYMLLEIAHILIHGFAENSYLKLQVLVIFSSIVLFIITVIAMWKGMFWFTWEGIKFRDWRNNPRWSDIHSFVTVQRHGTRLAIEYHGAKKRIDTEFRRPRQIIGHPFEAPPEEMADLLNLILEQQIATTPSSISNNEEAARQPS